MPDVDPVSMIFGKTMPWIRPILMSLCVVVVGASADAGWSDRQRAVLESHLSAMPLPNPLIDDQVLVDDTMQLLGSVATALLVRSDRSGTPIAGGPALMAATTLISGMPRLRTSLDRLSDASEPEASRDAARHDLLRFARGVRLHLSTLSVPDPGAFDSTLESMLQPLRSAIGHLEQMEPPSGWWMRHTSVMSEDAVVPLMELVDSADWVTKSQRTKLQARIDEGRAVLEPEELQARIRPLLSMAQSLTDIRELPEGRMQAKRLAPVFVEAFMAGSGALPDPSGTSELARGLERARDFRRHERGDLPRNLRTVHVRLSELYARAERTFFEQSTRMLDSISPRSDPSLVVFIEDQRDNLDALSMLVQFPNQLEFVRSIDPASVLEVERQLRAMFRDVLSPNQREDAMRALRNLSWQLNAFRALPLEEKMLAADPKIDEVLAFRGRGIADHVASARRELVQDWGRGDVVGGGATSMEMARRLLNLAEEALVFESAGSLDQRLDPWSGWVMPSGQLDRWQEELWVRLRIAATAMAGGDERETAAQLDRLESDLAVLQLAHLLIAIGPEPPGSSPAGAVVGQLAYPPRENSWLVEHRRDFHELSRLAMESQAAHDEGDDELAASLHDALASHAAGLHRRLAGSDERLMPIPGFDGSNPSPELAPLRLEHDRRR